MTKKQLINKYEEQIKHLKSQNKHMYVCETNSLHQSNGELYVEHENGLLVFDILNLFRDLPHWISLIKEGNKQYQEFINEQLKLSINE